MESQFDSLNLHDFKSETKFRALKKKNQVLLTQTNFPYFLPGYLCLSGSLALLSKKMGTTVLSRWKNSTYTIPRSYIILDIPWLTDPALFDLVGPLVKKYT
eukprot:UN08403